MPINLIHFNELDCDEIKKVGDIYISRNALLNGLIPVFLSLRFGGVYVMWQYSTSPSLMHQKNKSLFFIKGLAFLYRYA